MTLEPVTKENLKPVAGTQTQDATARHSQLRLVTAAGMLAFLGRQFDLLLAVLLLVAATNFSYLFSSPISVAGLSFLDHSWAFDLIVKVKQGTWLGRDVTFTYGPLFQLASSLPVKLLGGTLGAYFRSLHLIPFWSGILLTFLTGRMLLSRHSVWKRSFYLLALVCFWAALDLRFCFDFFALAVALRHFDRVSSSRMRLPWSTLGAVAVVFAGTLISADTGLYSCAAFVLAGAACLAVHRTDRQVRHALLRNFGIAAGFFVALALCASALMGFSFWLDSAAIVREYRWSMAASMEKAVKWRLIAASSFSILVLLVGSRWANSAAGSLSRRPAFFPAAVLFSLLTLQSSFIRPDWGHVFVALLPTLALAGAVLMGSERTPVWNWRGDLPVVLALVLTAAFSGVSPIFAYQNVVAGLRPPSAGNQYSCPTGTFFLDDACLSRANYEPLHAVSEYLRNHVSTEEKVAIFPFENLFADIARRRVAGGVLQNYIVVGDRLVHRQLAGLERDHPNLAVFSADNLATFGVDGVPNFTRTPDVWFFLQSRFVKHAELSPGIAALVRDQSRLRSWRQEAHVAGSSLASRVQLKRPISLPLDRWPADSDFIKLRLTVEYPIWWKLTKTSLLTITVRHADNSEKVLRAILPPNHPSDLWIYPWDDAQLINYFAAQDGDWRRGRPRAAVTEIRFTFERTDWLSVVPSTVNIQSIEAVRLRLQ